MQSHLIFDKPGVYESKLCLHTILWVRWEEDAPAPMYGVNVPNAGIASKFSQVIVVDENGKIVKLIEQKETR